MALHQRQVIRAAIVALLTGHTAAEARVVPCRRNPLRQSDLPAISVYTIDETVDDESAATAPRELTRRLEVVVQSWVPVTASIDDDMDALALEIETAMHADPFLGGAVGDSILKATNLRIDPEGKEPVGVVTMTYEVTYRTLAPEPPAESELDDFRRADTRFNLGGEQAVADQAEDLVTVQEDPP